MNLFYFLLTLVFCGLSFILYKIYGNPIFSSIFTSILISNLIYLFLKSIVKSKMFPVAFLMFFSIFYYVSGLLPITTRRDYLDTELWMILVSISVFFLWFGALLARVKILHNFSYTRIVKIRNLNNFLFYSLLFLALFSFLFIISKYGLLILNPENRFNVGTTWIYFIEFYVTAIICKFSIYTNKKDKIPKTSYFLLFFTSLMLLSIGYRNQFFILWLGLSLLYIYSNFENLKIIFIEKYKIITSVISFGFFALALMYYLRIQFSNETILNWNDRVNEYNVWNADYMLPFLSIHESSRETMGVAQMAFERLSQIENIVSLPLFLWMDFFTLLPGVSQTATGVLGQVVANSYETYLTPSAIGGIYISYGFLGLITFYLFFGYMIQKIWMKYKNTNRVDLLVYLVIFTVYFMQFTYRGIPKPMYIFSFILAYMLFNIKFGKKL